MDKFKRGLAGFVGNVAANVIANGFIVLITLILPAFIWAKGWWSAFADAATTPIPLWPAVAILLLYAFVAHLVYARKAEKLRQQFVEESAVKEVNGQQKVQQQRQRSAQKAKGKNWAAGWKDY